MCVCASQARANPVSRQNISEKFKKAMTTDVQYNNKVWEIETPQDHMYNYNYD